jgi:hypothetical protein
LRGAIKGHHSSAIGLEGRRLRSVIFSEIEAPAVRPGPLNGCGGDGGESYQLPALAP